MPFFLCVAEGISCYSFVTFAGLHKVFRAKFLLSKINLQRDINRLDLLCKSYKIFHLENLTLNDGNNIISVVKGKCVTYFNKCRSTSHTSIYCASEDKGEI